MKYIAVPCPICEGLVEKSSVKCVNCGVSWESIIRMCGEGISRTEEYLYRLATGPRVNISTLAEFMELSQEFIDQYTLISRYYQQMERDVSTR